MHNHDFFECKDRKLVIFAFKEILLSGGSLLVGVSTNNLFSQSRFNVTVPLWRGAFLLMTATVQNMYPDITDWKSD